MIQVNRQTPKISLLHATRESPEKALRTRDAWLTAAHDKENVEHIFAIQESDYLSEQAFSDRAVRYVTTTSPPRWASSSVDNWNAAAKESTGDVLIVIADDLLPFDGYDELIHRYMSQINRACVMHIPDGFRQDKLLCHPVMSRQAYQQLGFVFHPEYWGVWCDVDLEMEIKTKGILKVAVSDRQFKHSHPYAKDREWSDITALQNSEDASAYGERVFNARWKSKPSEPETVYSCWIGSAPGKMERLTASLIVGHGHNLCIFTDYEHCWPMGVKTLPIPEHLPVPVGFKGIPHEGLPNGGIGSLAHWSDLLAYDTICRHGGAWVQMDVACIASLSLPDYTFSMFMDRRRGIQPIVFKLPKGCKTAYRIVEDIIVPTSSGWQLADWHDSMTAQSRVASRHRMPVMPLPRYIDCGGMADSPFTAPLPEGCTPDFIHWSNATHGHDKETPVGGSEYERLLQLTNLL